MPVLFEDKWKPDEILADPCTCNSPELVCRLKYIPDPAGTDHWELPSETHERGGADCEGLSIAWLHAIIQEDKIVGSFVDLLLDYHLLIGHTSGKPHAVGRARSGRHTRYFDCRGITSEYRQGKKRPADFRPRWRLDFDGTINVLGQFR